MNKIGLQNRTKAFHIAIIKFCEQLPKNIAMCEIARQLIRAAGSVGANCRAISRAKSADYFIHKVSIVIEEADESHYWLEILKELNFIQNVKVVDRLIQEANELIAIFVAISKTSKIHKENHKLQFQKS